MFEVFDMAQDTFIDGCSSFLNIAKEFAMKLADIDFPFNMRRNSQCNTQNLVVLMDVQRLAA